MTGSELLLRLTGEQPGIETAVDVLVADRVASRLFAQDPTLWGPAAEAEASNRLGWVDAFDRADALVAEAEALRASLREQGVDRVVLCGMGGSSLAPEVIAHRYGAALTVLDSTHPDEVRRALSGDAQRTALVVSSKSGSTVETRSHLAAFEQRFREAGVDPASRIVIVTDPGSPLESAAAEAGYRTFLADPRVGGRYSALTAFGLVPVILAGARVQTLLDEARSAASALRLDQPDNPALRLAAALASGLPERYACALTEAEPSGLGDWIEQLVAESTGKDGRGILPLVLAPDAPELHGTALHGTASSESLPESANLVSLAFAESSGSPQAPIAVTAPLGAQFLLWEAATVVLCRLMGVNPFDQPDVESAKLAARAALAGGSGEDQPLRSWPEAGGVALLTAPGAASEALPETLAAALREQLAEIPAGGYLVVQAYLDCRRTAPLAQQLRDRLASTLGVPVVLGWGPRFLHSTGQLHKGGAPVGAFLQLLDRPLEDTPIPGGDGSFGALISAQARGDREVLIARGRPVLALQTEGPEACLRALIEML